MIDFERIVHYRRLIEKRHKISRELDKLYNGLLFFTEHSVDVSEQLKKIERKTDELKKIDLRITTYNFA